MEDLREEKQEALKAAGEYLERLIPGMRTLCTELKGDRQPDTDQFQKQCMDGLNWVIEIYNRITDVIDRQKFHITKEEFNACIGELGAAIREKEDARIVEVLEQSVIPFLTDFAEAAK